MSELTNQIREFEAHLRSWAMSYPLSDAEKMRLRELLVELTEFLQADARRREANDDNTD